MTEKIHLAKARWVDHDDLPLLSQASYLLIRPTFEIGDYTVTSDINDAEEYQFSIGLTDEPPRVLALFDEFEDAFEAALLIRQGRKDAPVFYEGNEVTAPVSGWRDLGAKLAHQGHDEAWRYFNLAMHWSAEKAREKNPTLPIPFDVPAVIRTVIERALTG